MNIESFNINCLFMIWTRPEVTGMHWTSSGNPTQVLKAIEEVSKDDVDDIVTSGLAKGGSGCRESAEDGWIYHDSFAGIGGHQ